MPKFLIETSYTLEGVKGVRSQRGTSRRDAAAQTIESVGGTLEGFYFAFGDTDVYVIADLPDKTEVKTFCPLMTHSLPSLTAVLRIAEGSEPAPGSVRAKQDLRVPSIVGMRYSFFCCSLPW